MVRIQLLRRSNEAERQRYAAEKDKILETAQAIRENTVELRAQLEEAQKTLALRKKYDELADRITGNRMLKPREEQHAQLQKLEKEISDLEEESRTYAQTWAERRTQFQRIVEEGKQMLRMIRDEKEEAERKEGMEENSDAGSRPGTPTPDAGGRTPAQLQQDGGSTPLRVPPKDLLAPEITSGRNSRASSPTRQSQAPATPRSREGTPAGSMAEQAEVKEASPLEEGEDTEMGEVGEVEETSGDVELDASTAMESDAPVQAEEGQTASAEDADRMEVT